MSCAGRRDDVLLLATGLLDEPEAEALRAHLAEGCGACASHLAEAWALEGALSLAADAAAPSAALRDELRRRIGVASRRGHAAPRPRVRRAALALAAGVGALVAGPLGWLAARTVARTELARQQAEVVALRQQAESLERDLAEVRSDQKETDDELAETEAHARLVESDLLRARRQVAMLARADLATLDLHGTAQPAARARVFWNWNDYYCYLNAEGLAPIQAPQVYALWLDTESGNRILAGTFAPKEEGHATLWVPLPRDMGRAVRASVTLEPEQPGPSPAGPVQLVSDARQHS